MSKKIVHDALILTAFTLILGFILGGVYAITKEPIALAEADAKNAAYRTVFTDADSFEPLDGFDKKEATEAVGAAGFKDSVDDVQVAKNSGGEALGYVITVTAKDASQDTITFAVGVRNDGTVNGYSITKIAETPGLGAKATEEAFYSQFENKNVDRFEVVKQTPSSENEIESISGATITSRAIANGVNAALNYFTNELGGE